ncbi:helix-turn-helix transcriptional regulator [Brevundimonas sp.]|uniref:helix-turn-helix transcriptional regulator n=1 Tax=Brevundimonas sp. TaxID=1871086 RepID=UPI0028B030B9|nr:helix-turn-helix transcriptional regulator [Brevundimonas sp.]
MDATQQSAEEIGQKIRTMRERARLSQAALAEAVGTTQQTIDRIEKGEVKHSRYTTPIISLLSLRSVSLRQEAALIHSAQASVASTHSRLISTYRLAANQELALTEMVEAPSFVAALADTYAVVLSKNITGPMGDVIFRFGDVLFLSPHSPLRHFDACLVRQKSLAAEGVVAIKIAIDPALTPTNSVIAHDDPHYVDIHNDAVDIHRVVAVHAL